MKFIRKILGSIYSELMDYGIQLPPFSIFFHQPNIALPYTYIETLHADINFTPEERAGILEAARAWEYFSNGLFKIFIIFDYHPGEDQDIGRDGTITKAAIDQKDVVRADGYYQIECWGLCAYRRGGVRDLFLVSDRIGNSMRDFTAVAMHEIGHYLWLPHITGSGVMHRNKYGVFFPTEDDAVEYAKNYGFRKDDFRYFLRF